MHALCNDERVEIGEQHARARLAPDAGPAWERIWREERARVLATLIGLLGSFDAAAEATQEAFAAALESWPRAGVPANPRAWLVSAGRHKAIDRMRRRDVRERREAEAALASEWVPATEAVAPAQEFVFADGDDVTSELEDDRLRLIFTCCHPALGQEAQVALTLRTLGGLTTEAIARAFLKPVATIAQRLVRAKAKIREARIPYRVPRREELQARLETVLLVVYLIFNEGYGAGPHEDSRRELCAQAIALGRVLLEMMPSEPEVRGLLALMLLQHARRGARYSASGDVVLLEAQDRSRWDREAIAEGARLTEQALRAGVGSYALQAAIAAVHDQAAIARETDWPQIVALYDVLLRLQPTPVVALNRAVAVAMAGDVRAALRSVEALRGLEEYCPYWAAKAQMLAWSGEQAAAREAYRRALRLAEAAEEYAQARFFAQRISELTESQRRERPRVESEEPKPFPLPLGSE